MTPDILLVWDRTRKLWTTTVRHLVIGCVECSKKVAVCPRCVKCSLCCSCNLPLFTCPKCGVEPSHCSDCCHCAYCCRCQPGN
jgi:hypothetical protein